MWRKIFVSLLIVLLSSQAAISGMIDTEGGAASKEQISSPDLSLPDKLDISATEEAVIRPAEQSNVEAVVEAPSKSHWLWWTLGILAVAGGAAALAGGGGGGGGGSASAPSQPTSGDVSVGW